MLHQKHKHNLPWSTGIYPIVTGMSDSTYINNIYNTADKLAQDRKHMIISLDSSLTKQKSPS